MLAIKVVNKKLRYIDQTKLPLTEVWKQCRTVKQGYQAIKALEVRGAPLIGVFAAYCLCLELDHKIKTKSAFFKKLVKDAKYLKSCRPTAVNLAWALDLMQKTAQDNYDQPLKIIVQRLWQQAKKIDEQDKQMCQAMAEYGASLVKDNDTILTHCNAGFLATSGIGTALGVIYQAYRKRKGIKVYADETRPLLQGARLTAWELMQAKVPVTVICDNMAGYLMQQGIIKKIFVGADRIAANGDTANKIGTYSLAVNAKYHKVPFYVVAPFSTFDLSIRSGKQIPIEQRDPQEVRTVLGKVAIAPEKVKVYNPAFDLTPNELITAIVTDQGIVYPPFTANIAKLIKIK